MHVLRVFDILFHATGLQSENRNKTYWRYVFVTSVLLTLFIIVLLMFLHPERGVQMIDFFGLPPAYLSKDFICSQVCNRFRHEYVLQPTKGCAGDVYLLILVMSAHTNAANRAAVRLTWGSVTNYTNHVIRVVFVLGTPPFVHPSVAYKSEHEKYGDLLVVSINDSYSTLTNRMASALRWTSELCVGARFVLKTDDDSFIVVSRTVNSLEKYHHRENAVLGQCASAITPIRDPERRRWFVSEAAYRDHYFPLYLRGSGYVLTREAVKRLLEAASFVRFNPMEDVFWTGQCRIVAKSRAVCWSGFHVNEDNFIASECDITSRDLFNIHHVSRDTMYIYWHWINKNTTQISCNTSKIHSVKSVMLILFISLTCYFIFKLKHLFLSINKS